MQLFDVAGPGAGMGIKNQSFVVWNRCGATPLVLGDIVMFDLASIDAATGTDADLGQDDSILANVTLPTTLGLGGLSGASLGTGNRIGYFFGVVDNLLDGAGADDTKVRVCVRGICEAKLTNADINIGYPLFPGNGVSTLSLTLAAGNKCVAIAIDDNASTAGVYTVLFNGIEGFGCPVAS